MSARDLRPAMWISRSSYQSTSPSSVLIFNTRFCAGLDAKVSFSLPIQRPPTLNIDRSWDYRNIYPTQTAGQVTWLQLLNPFVLDDPARVKPTSHTGCAHAGITVPLYR